MRSRYLILLLVVAAIGGRQSALAQQSGTFQDKNEKEAGTIRIDTSLVLIDGIVLNKRTRAVVGDLKQEDFSILDNDRPQAITHFSREELPLSVVLLLDVSGSVQPIIEEVRSAAVQALGALKPQDSVATMIFGNRTKLVTHLTRDRQSIRDGLDDMWSSAPEVGFGTVITHAVYSASRYLKQSTGPTERRAIILITDDEDFRYSVPPREAVLRELLDSGSTLCGIIVSHGKAGRTAVSVGTTAAITAVNPILGGVLIGMKILRKASSPGSTSRFFTENSGGVLVGAKKEEVGRVFIEMMQLLRTRYTFGYEPPETPDDGRMRRIRLSVKQNGPRKKGDLLIIARSGYYLTPSGRNQDQPLLALKTEPVSAPLEPLIPQPVAPASSVIPELHRISMASLSPSYQCRPPEEKTQGYRNSALYLTSISERLNTPDLLFSGACGSPDYFIAATSGDDLSLIADLGDVPIEGLSAYMAFRSSPGGDGTTDHKFARSVKVDFNHTYAVLLNRSSQRGLFFFRVTGYLPNKQVDLSYVVKQYQLLNVREGAAGFDWLRKNSAGNPEKP
ncbi:MAG: VWA domain-containing protein [Acidobacteriota bacterium]|nr:MAG: VWA domain-containing protein [Acidobacteriota bacterium]